MFAKDTIQTEIDEIRVETPILITIQQAQTLSTNHNELSNKKQKFSTNLATSIPIDNAASI